MEPLNPYESPRGEVPSQGLNWQDKLAGLAQQSRVSWGATLCFWALVVYLIFNVGSTLMVLMSPIEQGFEYYFPLRRYGTWGAELLHAVGLVLLCFIGEQTRAKLWFKLALGCYLAHLAWQFLPYLETLEQREAAPIPKTVEYLAQLTQVFSPLFLMIALRRVSFYAHDRQMLRWSFVAQFLYTIMAIAQAVVLALYILWQGLLQDLLFKYRLDYFRIFELANYTLLIIGLPVAYCYGRILRKIAVLWDQPPAE